MRPRVVISDFKAHMRTWYRSKGGMFWTMVFPVLLMLIFGAIFSGQEDYKAELFIQDLDGGPFALSYIDNLSAIFNVKTIPAEEDILRYVRDRGLRVAVLIPENFSQDIAYNTQVFDGSIEGPMVNTNITIYSDPTATTSQIVNHVISSYNLHIAMGLQSAEPFIQTIDEPVTTDEFKFIDFFLPGMIGFSIMTTAVYGTVFRNVKYKEDGILRKLTTTPLRRSEWLMGIMLFMTLLALISAALIIIVGIVVFQVSVILNPIFLVIIVAEAFAFAGLGMIISRFVQEEETADSTAGAITFPMMFLAGTFFPLEQMPGYLQTIARFLPLYYVNEGLRDAMIYNNHSGALFHTSVILGIAVVFFAAGVLLTKWKE